MNLYDTLIIGIDPGKTVGFARLYNDGFKQGDLSYEKTTDVLDLMTAWATLQQVPFIVSVERFTQHNNRVMTRQNDALELIGVARFLARKRGAVKFMLNGVTDAQRMAPPDVLRQLGWWKPGGDHLNKAAAQVAYAVALTWPDDFARLTGM